MTQIQSDYAYHQQAGQVGQNARPIAPCNVDQGIAGVELKPGDGVYYVSGSNWIKPVDDATRKLVTHIVGFNANSINVNIAAPTTNNNTEVVYAIGDIITKLYEFGSVWVLAGETVESQDSAIYNESTGKWIKYNPSAPDASDLRKKAFTFYLPPGLTADDGDLVEVRINCENYSFASLGQIGANTIKVSIPATEIKTLRATPKELVAAQGANTLIQLVAVMLVLTAGSEVLTETADNLVIEFDDGSAAPVTGDIEMTGFIDQVADTVTNAIPIGDVIDASLDVLNKNLAIVNTGDGEIAGNASDDAVLDVYITYRTLDLS